MLTFYSLSEYGCNTNTRAFQEVSALYNPEMTFVYSGGLVYEYSQEASNYGLVVVNGNSVTERADFKALQTAYANTPNPSGDGGYNTTGGASSCPAQDLPNWAVANDVLPAIPEPAKKYMTEGAGPGPGLNGPGSQDAGVASSGTATPGSGAVTGTPTGASSTSTSKAASAALRAPEYGVAPFVCGLVVVVSTLFGATLL
jgi:hypothetical protein